MKILVTNDDGYQAKGIHALVDILKPYGDITVVAPKYHQSGMSMAVSLGFRPIAVKNVGMIDGVNWYYVDGTPATAAKYAMDNIFPNPEDKPDVIVSGINHGSNSSTAAWYSGTIGAAREGSLAKVQAIAVSLDNLSRDADFSVVAELFPAIFEKLMANRNGRANIIYNVNFPDLPASEIKGVKAASQGNEIWIEEFIPWSEDIFKKLGITPRTMGIVKIPELEPGESRYMMAGSVLADPNNTELTDNCANEKGYISITPMQMDNTDYSEIRRLQEVL